VQPSPIFGQANEEFSFVEPKMIHFALSVPRVLRGEVASREAGARKNRTAYTKSHRLNSAIARVSAGGAGRVILATHSASFR